MTGAAFHDRIATLLGEDRPERIGAAVSGGSDSLALLYLMADWGGAALCAVTVDHGLRPEAADEARQVATICARLNIPHTTLRWQGWDGSGNLQDQARRARYGLIADWARGQGIAHVALGHTADDVAETFLMRLARSAGLDGLAAMAPRRDHLGVAWLRPMLDMRRQALRDMLSTRGQAWIDDPSNANRGFDRVRARRALEVLEPLGLGVDEIARSAVHLDRSRAALAEVAKAAADQIARADYGDVLIDRAGLAAQPTDIARRLVSAARVWVSSADYAPRSDALALFLDQVLAGRQAMLHGCLALADGPAMRITREYAAVRDLRVPGAAIWDGRWQFLGETDSETTEIAALGDAGLRACPNWRETGRPRAALIASPALYVGGELVSAPLAGFSGEWRLKIAPNCPDFHASLISR